MATKPTVKKASTSTEIVLGQAAQQIAKGVSELKSASETISQLVKASEDLSLQVANKETQIADLDVQFAEKARQKEVELDLNFKASQDRVVTNYLTENGKVAISKTDLANLQKELADTKANAEAVTKKEVAIVSASLKSQYENEIKLIQSENNTKSVENASKIGTLTEQKNFLETQVAKLYQQLDAERAAGIERAKAGSVGSINVGSDNRK
jgi:hypothetical protein